MSVFDLSIAYPLIGAALFIVSAILLTYIKIYGNSPIRKSHLTVPNNLTVIQAPMPFGKVRP